MDFLAVGGLVGICGVQTQHHSQRGKYQRQGFIHGLVLLVVRFAVVIRMGMQATATQNL